MNAKTRMYVVTDSKQLAHVGDTKTGSTGERLVEAVSAAQARKHCSKHIEVRVAKTSDVVRLMREGISAEKANESPDEEKE